jgi:hypothetical protein
MNRVVAMFGTAGNEYPSDITIASRGELSSGRFDRRGNPWLGVSRPPVLEPPSCGLVSSGEERVEVVIDRVVDRPGSAGTIVVVTRRRLSLGGPSKQSANRY